MTLFSFEETICDGVMQDGFFFKSENSNCSAQRKKRVERSQFSVFNSERSPLPTRILGPSHISKYDN